MKKKNKEQKKNKKKIKNDQKAENNIVENENLSEETKKNIEENNSTKKENDTTSVKKEESPEDKIEALGVKLAELNDKYLRQSAEYDNYRRRTLKEKMELTKTANEKVLVNILPVIDNLERALVSIQETDDIKALEEGVSLIYNNFKDFIKQHGVKEIEAINVVFDTDFHEALTKIPAPNDDLKGKVVDVIEKGYTLNDKVIRFAKVVIGE